MIRRALFVLFFLGQGIALGFAPAAFRGPLASLEAWPAFAVGFVAGVTLGCANLVVLFPRRRTSFALPDPIGHVRGVSVGYDAQGGRVVGVDVRLKDAAPFEFAPIAKGRTEP